MINLEEIKSDQSKRKTNLIIQIILVAILCFNGVYKTIAYPFILWQIVHFFHIAIADYYLDDYSQKTRNKTLLLLVTYLIFLGISLFYGIFDELYVRIHVVILIFGNLLGKKIDQLYWKILTVLNLAVIIAVEVLKNEFKDFYMIAILYILGAICLLGLTERLSEKNKNVWILHSLILFGWIFYEGYLFQEAFFFLIGGCSYELSKILINSTFKSEVNHVN